MQITKEMKMLAIVVAVVLVIASGFFLFAKNEKDEKQASTQDLSAVMFKKTSDHSFSVGTKTARVTVVEFFDPECETCAQVAPYIKNEVKYYSDKVRWVFRYMAYHPNSKNAIRILEAARKQNLYLDALALMFERQGEWGQKHDGTDKGTSKEKELLNIVSSVPGINMQKLKADMNDPAVDEMIAIDKQEGEAMGVTGTPTLFVNGKIIDPLNLDTMISRIDAALK